MTASKALDTQWSFETPEGVELTLAPAGPIVRAVAFGIDLLLRAAAYLALGTMLSLLQEGGTGIMLVCVFLLEWGYPVFFEVKRGGSTPGKHVMDLAVVHDDGSPVALGASLLRNLIRFADFLPAGYLLGTLSCLSNARFQRLGDLAAGTFVIHRQSEELEGVPTEEEPQPLLAALTRQEQRAVVAFAVRCPRWTAQRQEELASHTGDATHGGPRERVRQLKAHARWIAGAR